MQKRVRFPIYVHSGMDRRFYTAMNSIHCHEPHSMVVNQWIKCLPASSRGGSLVAAVGVTPSESTEVVPIIGGTTVLELCLAVTNSRKLPNPAPHSTHYVCIEP